MSDQIKHECGIAFIRLLKPLSYYKEKYGTWMYGINKLYLLMEKQHNRGQDGAGALCVKIDQKPGKEYIFRERSIQKDPIPDIFANIHKNFVPTSEAEAELMKDPQWAQDNLPFAGNVYMGHLRLQWRQQHYHSVKHSPETYGRPYSRYG